MTAKEKYVRRVARQLPLRWRRRFCEEFSEELCNFEEKHPDAAYEDYCAAFRDPADVALDRLSEDPPRFGRRFFVALGCIFVFTAAVYTVLQVASFIVIHEPREYVVTHYYLHVPHKTPEIEDRYSNLSEEELQKISDYSLSDEERNRNVSDPEETEALIERALEKRLREAAEKKEREGRSDDR